MEDGRALGCRRFVAETGADDPDAPKASLRSMFRVGFEAACFRTNGVPRSAP